MSGYRVAVVGATGAVGREVLRILEERHFPYTALRLIASARSAGTRIGASRVEVLSPEVFTDIDLAIFDTPDEVAREWVPRVTSRGVMVIDNSAAFRMAPDVPLVIPEINAHALRHIPRGLVANPNCTVATFAVPLAPLHREAGLRRVIACSYQSASGAGQRGVTQLWAEVKELASRGRPLDAPLGEAFAHPLAMNVIPAVGSSMGEHFSEEVKVAAELRKIYELPELPVGITCVRVPTLVAHGVAVHAEFARSLTPSRARELLSTAAGVNVIDDPGAGRYPTPLAAMGRDPCYVGRIRADGAGNLAFFAVADNLRKGAALNAVQIAEHLVTMALV